MAISEIPSIFILAEAAPGGGMSPFITIGLLFLGMWFLVIAPQRKRQKEHDAMLAALQTGDDVVTSGGIYGTITNVKEDRFVIRIADNTKIEIGKNFVSSKVNTAA